MAMASLVAGGCVAHRSRFRVQHWPFALWRLYLVGRSAIIRPMCGAAICAVVGAARNRTKWKSPVRLAHRGACCLRYARSADRELQSGQRRRRRCRRLAPGAIKYEALQARRGCCLVGEVALFVGARQGSRIGRDFFVDPLHLLGRVRLGSCDGAIFGWLWLARVQLGLPKGKCMSAVLARERADDIGLETCRVSGANIVVAPVGERRGLGHTRKQPCVCVSEASMRARLIGVRVRMRALAPASVASVVSHIGVVWACSAYHEARFPSPGALAQDSQGGRHPVGDQRPVHAGICGGSCPDPLRCV